jgi:hypothetical protein
MGCTRNARHSMEPVMKDLFRDMRYGLRGLRKRPSFALLVIYLFDAQVRCLPGIISPQACLFDDRIKFALDLGGVLEFYPSRRTVIRFDVGDALIRFDRARLTPVPAFRAEVTHNLQLNVGVGLRF